MVTGLLFIELDFRPDTEVKLRGLNNKYLELPTAPSAMGELMAKVKDAVSELGALPFDQVMDEVVAILKRVKDILSRPEMDEGLANLGSILQETKTGLHETFQQIPTLLEQFDTVEDEAVSALRALRALSKDAQTLVRNVNTQVAPLSSSAQGALTAARGALQQGQKSIKNLEVSAKPALGQADRALASIADATGPDSLLLNDLSQTLKEIEEAARALRILANALERNPESLIRGKGR
jgi:paraquat-inducible protein B